MGASQNLRGGGNGDGNLTNISSTARFNGAQGTVGASTLDKDISGLREQITANYRAIQTIKAGAQHNDVQNAPIMVIVVSSPKGGYQGLILEGTKRIAVGGAISATHVGALQNLLAKVANMIFESMQGVIFEATPETIASINAPGTTPLKPSPSDEQMEFSYSFIDGTASMTGKENLIPATKKQHDSKMPIMSPYAIIKKKPNRAPAADITNKHPAPVPFDNKAHHARMSSTDLRNWGSSEINNPRFRPNAGMRDNKIDAPKPKKQVGDTQFQLSFGSDVYCSTAESDNDTVMDENEVDEERDPFVGGKKGGLYFK